MKRSLYVFIIATLLLTGCSLKSETQGSTESSTTGSTSDSTTYSETTESVLSEETFVPDEHYDGDLFYSLVVDYVELRSLGEDEPLYSMTQIEDHDVLLINDADDITVYCKSDDELVIWEDEFEIDADEYLWLSDEELLQIPFFCRLNINRITGPASCGPVVFDQQISDGLYFGETIGMSEDGKNFFLFAGTSYIVSEEYIDALSVGDEIGIDGYTVTSIDNGEVFVNEIYWFTNESRYTNDYILIGESNHPITTDNFIAVIPVADDVMVEDSQLYNHYPDAFEDYTDDTASGIAGSFWYSLAIDNPGMQAHDGWYQTSWFVYPFTVQDGVITEIAFECR